MAIVLETVLRVVVDIDSIAELKQTDIRDHIKKAIKSTGYMHPEDPLFRAIEQVKLSKVRFYKV